MNAIWMEDQVKLTNILKAFIECFNKDLNQIQNSKLRFTAVDTKDKIERRVVTIDKLAVGWGIVN